MITFSPGKLVEDVVNRLSVRSQNRNLHVIFLTALIAPTFVLIFSATNFVSTLSVLGDAKSLAIQLDCSRPSKFEFSPSMRLDADSDSMDDNWEQRFGLNINDPTDAILDLDSDGYTNLDEYLSGTEPNNSRYNPGIIEITNLGFDCYYIVETGYINEDNLIDILIRDPDRNYIPAIRDFVMIQNSEQGFTLDEAINYDFEDLSPIQSAVVVAELNGDSAKDLALIGLSRFIPDAKDQIIYAPSGETVARGINLDTIPFSHQDLSAEVVTFFQDVDNWLSSRNLNSTNEEVDAQALDLDGSYTSFNQDAAIFIRDYLLSILSSGVMIYPSEESTRIYSILSDKLNSGVFYDSYMAPIGGGLNLEFDQILDQSIVGSIQRVLAIVADRFVRGHEL